MPTTEEAPVPDVPHVLVHEDNPSILEPIQDEPTVCHSEPQPSQPIEIPTTEQQGSSPPQIDVPIGSSSPSQPIVEPIPHESSHEPIHEPIQEPPHESIQEPI